MAIGARSDNDRSAKPEKQNKGRRKGELRQNTVRTTSEKNALNLLSLYQKATVSIRVTYQKYSLDLLKTYHRLTKKLPTRYREVGNKLVALYRNATADLHAFGSLTVASARRVRLSPSKRSAVFSTFLLCLVVLFSDAQAQSAGERAVEGLTEISIPGGGMVIGDSLPEAFWNQELQVINHPQGLTKIKLADYRDKLLVLDFLNTACVPCIASVDKWHQLQERYRQEVAVLPVHLYGDNQRIGPFAEKKGWTLPIAVGNTADTIINRLFYSYKSFGQVWIHDGRLLAIPHHKDVTPELIGKALRRIPLGITMNDFLTYFDKRYTGGAADGKSR
ncbi:hypothetical protein GCM10011418_39730 [Sphingobacterium alkalisoli]|nr:hypothetical protein GCM10011418_39730 [Sphingobacterium alkalisoli]